MCVCMCVCVVPSLVLSLCVPVLCYADWDYAGDISVSLYLFIDGDAGESSPAYMRACVKRKWGVLWKSLLPLLRLVLLSFPWLLQSKYLSNSVLMTEQGRPRKCWLFDLWIAGRELAAPCSLSCFVWRMKGLVSLKWKFKSSLKEHLPDAAVSDNKLRQATSHAAWQPK